MRIALAGLSALALLSAALPVAAHEADQVRQELRHRGYYDIQFVVAEPPQFQVNACLEGQRFHLHVDFYGQVTERSSGGPCRPQWRSGRYEDRAYGQDR